MVVHHCVRIGVAEEAAEPFERVDEITKAQANRAFDTGDRPVREVDRPAEHTRRQFRRRRQHTAKSGVLNRLCQINQLVKVDDPV